MKNNIRNIFIIFLIMAFLSGIYLILSLKISNPTNPTQENMTDQTSSSNSDCPDMLVQRGNILLLFNSNKPMDDSNPIPFYNLDEYINYLEIQKKKGIDCPVLYLIMEYNAQGEEVYRIRPSPFELQPGLPTMSTPALPPVPAFNTGSDLILPPVPRQTIQQLQPLDQTQITPKQQEVIKRIDASRENAPYNSNSYSGFDSHGLYVGQYTDLDQIHDSTSKVQLSDNPMDPNWGGQEYTRLMIESGKYNDNNITMPLLFQPRTAYYPISEYGVSPPVDIL
jgi:hypothetical protein